MRGQSSRQPHNAIITRSPHLAIFVTTTSEICSRFSAFRSLYTPSLRGNHLQPSQSPTPEKTNVHTTPSLRGNHNFSRRNLRHLESLFVLHSPPTVFILYTPDFILFTPDSRLSTHCFIFFTPDSRLFTPDFTFPFRLQTLHSRLYFSL